ncbi:2-amino-4-hydroxy-6-hydroxymethyldihydropteridine diphosphokinase [Porphyromonas crevioricanis]|uniref:2-amino-4-hydroxy-6- hydroxymethyldihydropteridine diphosphokinase n=1 Tax=Porphyromonas crevioricanis TaxID=393921 RepID=UPI0009E05084|nr:2-amino-4-hydroxy-6-hydroxymethyldihydropteridine diphosphokinase [Porphyromonas crevioricanis]
MSTLCLGLGSNTGDRLNFLSQAVGYVREYADGLIEVSSVYRTQPLDFDTPNYFLNAVALVYTERSLIDWLYFTQKVEREMGRTTKSVNKKYSDRIIDIDLLLYDRQEWHVCSPQTLFIPHPEMHKRAFVLYPLAELFPDWVHPSLGYRVVELRDTLDRLSDERPVLIKDFSL